MVKVRKLIDTVTGRPAKTGPYGSLAMGKGRDRRVITVPKEVAKLLMDKFNDWMGKDRQSWFSGLEIGDDSMEGRRLRIKMANVKSEFELEELMVEAKIPMKFRPIVILLRRKKGVKEGMYKHLMNPISESEWMKFWGQVKKGTAPGKTGVTADMVFILRDKELDVIRRMTNMVLVPGLAVYDHWKERVISPVPKEEGNFNIDRARPLVLLEVVQKAFWAILTARMTGVWEDNDLLNDMQFGFRKGRSVTAPALMASLIAEERVHEKKPFYAFSQDISKAYDTVSRHVGKEIAWRRLGVPERFIEMLLDMDRGNRTVVVTAFGCTDELLGEEKGTFEYMRGFCQGASESPAGWVALYDIFLDLQAKYAEAMNYFGSVFADDALWVANTRLLKKEQMCQLFSWSSWISNSMKISHRSWDWSGRLVNISIWSRRGGAQRYSKLTSCLKGGG